ncbi:protein FAR1-RELATED SEQUENCE 5-like [Gossypium australe]|uniref:Protein FAR1-RELATED SEQUENCE 5-like n=1 Tax=Gossypium australe TaxID=47621 RepID=A0A5B6UYC9_9ROSI|nr:protein FAR1-RELATED SEQUENCE 5-like [Gossypium australe]
MPSQNLMHAVLDPTCLPSVHEWRHSYERRGVLEDALQLKLFPYSLRDRARVSLNALPLGTVAS